MRSIAKSLKSLLRKKIYHGYGAALLKNEYTWGSNFDTAKQIFTKATAPAKSLAGITGSYSTNEVTIYWK